MYDTNTFIYGTKLERAYDGIRNKKRRNVGRNIKNRTFPFSLYFLRHISFWLSNSRCIITVYVMLENGKWQKKTSNTIYKDIITKRNNIRKEQE